MVGMKERSKVRVFAEASKRYRSLKLWYHERKWRTGWSRERVMFEFERERERKRDR